jgi:hypothetical protein
MFLCFFFTILSLVYFHKMSFSKPEGARHKTDALRALDKQYRSVIKKTASKILDEVILDERIGTCWLCTITPSQDTPQMQVTVGLNNTITLQCVHIVLLSQDIEPNHWYNQASHRCGNRYCINPAHLLWELPWDNLSRDGCHKYNHFKECPHNPPCLPEPNFAIVKEILQERLETKPLVDPLLATFRNEVEARKKRRIEQGIDPGYHSKSKEYNELYWKMVKSVKKAHK